ncbi:hypothetical protein P389DRAFT_193759 [Cystobasidium minutum MCA 4210]|uniref:uncharacterized protein n=1 Tax=Cystobasidium minutum MCA 4210 TaxID=1397322 RepID=UPI0034D01E53|eukprot:jgi/Rhomi1/193759/gm1.1973_g
MADNLRQDPVDKIKAAVKPEAQKPWTEQQGDKLSGKTDKLASHMQPESNKSTSQKVIDTITPGNDAHSHVGDTGRQGPLDAARAAIVPDSMKSDSQHAKDYTKGKADDLGSHAQSEHDKSIGQKIKDFITPGGATHSHDAHCRHDGVANDHSAHASDAYRQSTTDKLGNALKPDAMKSSSEVGKDNLKGHADNMAGTAVHHEDKSVGQKIADGLNPNATA